MPRANRYHFPGCVWHITHRCHKKEFLLKFARDRGRWIHWLFEAKKRYGLTVLNYMVTSNHIHLLVLGGDDPMTIALSLQLIAGRTAQEYNLRKKRTGAFWEDRYHATAVQTGIHLKRCMAYIDLNMVRARVLHHPSEWQCCGYTAIQHPGQRYQIVDRQRAAELLGFDNVEELAVQQRLWAESDDPSTGERHAEWTESLAVGDQQFVEATMQRLGIRARHRMIIAAGDAFTLRESAAAYSPVFDPEIEALSVDNTRCWNVSC